MSVSFRGQIAADRRPFFMHCARTATRLARWMVSRQRLVLALLLFSQSVPAALTIKAPDPELAKLLKQAMMQHTGFKDRFDAEVWLKDMSNRLKRTLPEPVERLKLLRLVHAEAIHAHLPPEMVLAVIDVESHFDRFAVSSAGALGLMQVMPFWLKEIGRPGDNLFHPRTNLRMGCTILHYYLKRAHGDLRGALERYNGTSRRAYADRVFTRLSEKWFRQ